MYMTKCGTISIHCLLTHKCRPHLHYKPLVNVLLSDGGLKVWRLKKTKKELIDNL